NKDIPLVLMNSFSTEEKSTERLKKYPEIKTSLPFSFIQNKYPKVLKEDLTPAEHPENPELEWNPPGHGDIYTALKTSGMMDKLIASGRKYCFVSNIDNLGATLDTSILGYFAENQIPFLMEVAKRTEMDKKGGHLAQKKDGGYLLREIAQTREEDVEKFQDINRFSYFNTNSIWINLEHLKELMDKHNGMVPLPLIVNSKTLDPRDSASPEVYQLETAMGSAVTLFNNADAIEIPRTRFKPVKKTNDLLLLRSDRYRINEKYELTESDDVTTPYTNVSLDSDYYKKIDMLDKRFPYGAPSMVDCTSLKVKGDVEFGEYIKLQGDVEIVNTSDVTAKIENNKRLSGRVEL
ncbi:MAG: UTP--glucose-1-phosphate uridylyltransferase, partial [Chitinivibrionales bacterium]